MIDLSDIAKEFAAHIGVRKEKDGTYYSVPFYHYGSDESIAITVGETDDGRPCVTDCGTTYDYWQMRDVNPAEYGDRINAVISRFGLIRDGELFRKVINGTGDISVRDALSDFLSALCILAHIDL